MNRRRAIAVVVVALIVALGIWVARHTYWTEITVPLPMRGEARTNPFYVAQRLTAALGARGIRDAAFTAPPTEAVLVLSEWRWNLFSDRRGAVEQWVNEGGRLVVDQTIVEDQEFQRWSGIALKTPDDEAETPPSGCRNISERGESTRGNVPLPLIYQFCDDSGQSSLTAEHAAAWTLSDRVGAQVVRMTIGKGSVTAVNATPFAGRQILEGDHAALFVGTTQLRTGDEVHFLTEADYPSLAALVWRLGGPSVMLAAVLIAAWLWRSGVSFGPLVAAPGVARRALAEQILSTGEFTARHGGTALLSAAVRALDEASLRRRPGLARLSRDERRAAGRQMTGLDEALFAGAGDGGRAALGDAIRNIETARQSFDKGSR